ncbi:hypothetical protein Nos7524_1420 [Nostoc sp. PCC 7524]|uniref:hypothetical protein n=1 Tax=Nostoc sp. (strain ATCC 29411 / PCC 7524) TaxID=28072 RepID=UPI00029EF5DD|nr:hypothetical protein [Nostoc sp. PCC 7524]AFY47299.1 hypothetical protein Nos7524_1420 [Nostoc sp. PCC 7524]
MKKNVYNIFSRLAIAVTVVLATLLITTPVAANETQPINVGAIHPREPNFFSRGREQFETEIQLLMMRSGKVTDNLLKVSPEIIQIQDKLSPLEKYQIEPGNVDSDESPKLINQDSQISP